MGHSKPWPSCTIAAAGRVILAIDIERVYGVSYIG
jgi:hypothetical protein